VPPPAALQTVPACVYLSITQSSKVSEHERDGEHGKQESRASGSLPGGESRSAQTVRCPCRECRGTEPSQTQLLKGWPGWLLPAVELLGVGGREEWLGAPALPMGCTKAPNFAASMDAKPSCGV